MKIKKNIERRYRIIAGCIILFWLMMTWVLVSEVIKMIF
jgi:hypothetical protein